MEREEIGGYIAIIEWDKPINGVSSLRKVDSFLFLLQSIRTQLELYAHLSLTSHISWREYRSLTSLLYPVFKLQSKENLTLWSVILNRKYFSIQKYFAES